MKYNKLGQTDLVVSELCLGTMTWGTQNTAYDAFYQIEKSMDAGINFIDTAELYPVNPISGATQGESERILGNWLNKSNSRDKLIIATKIAGNGPKHIRNGEGINKKSLFTAIEASLKSLKTDYIDLYQLHWPNRGSYHFRQNWRFDPTNQDKSKVLDHINEVLEACEVLKKAGKVRAFGLSNESAWGTAQWLRISEDKNLPRMDSIQNEYSLMCRMFDTDLAELCHNDNVGLLSFSPLATGILSGKYLDGAVPEGSRGSIVNGLSGRMTSRVDAATRAYIEVAKKYDLDTCQMALAWCRTRPFMASAIFGARTNEQLSNALDSVNIVLTEECLRDIEKAHKQNPMPF
ncbi:aldo/keto reductase [Amylibacter sp.]|jgi:aryl-alcohol dehydrogenase-like predicted oxidoreductase|nr:aldo/keto reductase [Amylibacter sp.]MDC3300526.1 aldo/keto reductase [bacterium]MDA9005102.1 aldo/keto reductase [Amylibacter sp.]MDB0015612.1 aldo/keto reductase [Amylibacter sp.]MDB2472412.1 aldo/keto reductase [Amylibacter sp.]|tara:strand:- start:121 stop:1164 length:1044 start_codon:yes stop_codon:yes gene_type:complete